MSKKMIDIGKIIDYLAINSDNKDSEFCVAVKNDLPDGVIFFAMNQRTLDEFLIDTTDVVVEEPKLDK